MFSWAVVYVGMKSNFEHASAASLLSSTSTVLCQLFRSCKFMVICSVQVLVEDNKLPAVPPL